jgi:hypothetical protein
MQMSGLKPSSLAHAAALAAVVMSGPADAASQGSLGPGSQGTITISVSVAAPARIAGLLDFALDADQTTGSAALARTLCLQGAARAYAVAASGSGPDGTLSLSNGGESVAYRVEWVPGTGDGPAQSLGGDTPVTLQALADAAECASSNGSGQLRIALDSADAQKIETGTPYTGSMVLMLAPE